MYQAKVSFSCLKDGGGFTGYDDIYVEGKSEIAVYEKLKAKHADLVASGHVITITSIQWF